MNKERKVVPLKKNHVLNFFINKNSNIFILGGGSGFLGRALTQLLRSRGHEVTLISRHPGKDRITWVRAKG